MWHIFFNALLGSSSCLLTTECITSMHCLHWWHAGQSVLAKGNAVCSNVVVLALLPTGGATVDSTEKVNVCLVLTMCTYELSWMKLASAASMHHMKQNPYGAQLLHEL